MARASPRPASTRKPSRGRVEKTARKGPLEGCAGFSGPTGAAAVRFKDVSNGSTTVNATWTVRRSRTAAKVRHESILVVWQKAVVRFLERTCRVFARDRDRELPGRAPCCAAQSSELRIASIWANSPSVNGAASITASASSMWAVRLAPISADVTPFQRSTH